MIRGRALRALAASVTGGGSRMFSRGASFSRRPGRSGVFAAAGLVGGTAVLVGALAANPAHSKGVAEEEESLSTRMLKMLGLHSWVVWAVEPAEKAGCPPGTLLPDPPEMPPGMIQRTLVLSLEDTLIHTQWDRKRGHRTQKRPGLDAFLAHMSQFYEIIIFTSAMQGYAQPIAMQLQENGHVRDALYRESTKYVDGKFIKDLSYLNRDIRHIVIVDTNADSYANQPLNAVPIKPWQGDLDDTALLDLVPFLEAIFKEDIQDVRDVLRHFEGVNVPDKFRELRQQALERKRKGGGGLIGRSTPKGVLPVLSVLAPASKSPALPAIKKEPKKEAPAPKKKADAPVDSAPSKDGESKPAQDKADTKKSVFQMAKERRV